MRHPMIVLVRVFSLWAKGARSTRNRTGASNALGNGYVHTREFAMGLAVMNHFKFDNNSRTDAALQPLFPGNPRGCWSLSHLCWVFESNHTNAWFTALKALVTIVDLMFPFRSAILAIIRREK